MWRDPSHYTIGIGTWQVLGREEAAASSNVARTPKAGADAASVANQAGLALPFDEVTLSSAGNLVGQTLSASDVRADRVAALQQSIAAGTYSVSSSDVAASVLRAQMKYGEGP
jgi:flagellar biosynthesis anti-sigma factor FlgM